MKGEQPCIESVFPARLHNMDLHGLRDMYMD